MAAVVEKDETISNVSLNEFDLSGSERIVHGVAHRPQLFTFLYKKRGKNLDDVLTTIESKTKINREQWGYVILFALALYMIFGSFAELICNVAGFAYPAYASVKAIRTKEKEDDTQWLMYWTVFATFSLADSFASSITRVLPTFWLFKAAFLLYLYIPNTDATRALFYKVVNPTISAIDDLIATYERKHHRKLN